jgi:uncharacterized protein YggE
MNKLLAALMISAALPLAPAAAQVKTEIAQPITGTRLDIAATGEVTRVPNLAIISAGVVTRSTTASGALQENASRMERVIAALKSAGVEDRDIQTSSINLNPEYRYRENEAPQLVGYTASNQVTIRFREIRNSGRILDALVAQGANQINGPTMTIEQPQAALDEARANAVAIGRARAELYARALGKRVARVISISESGSHYAPPPPMPIAERGMAMAADTKILPGEQKLEVTLSMVFELQ